MHTNEPAIPGDKSKQECKQQDSGNTEEGASGSSQAMRGMRAILRAGGGGRSGGGGSGSGRVIFGREHSIYQGNR